MAESAEQRVTILALLKDQVTPFVTRIRGGFRGLKDEFNNIGAALSPLTGRVAQFIGAFVGIEGFRKSIGVAEEYIAAQQALKVALGDNADQYDRLEKKAEAYRKTTIASTADILKTTATLLNRGVPVTQIDEALQLTLDTNARLGGDLEGTGEKIARVYGGKIPRELKFAVKELRNFDDENADAALALDVLRKKFEGSAEAIAKTPFGRAKQESNALDESYARLGNQLIKLKVAFLQGLSPALDKITSQLESQSGQHFLSVLSTITTKVVELLPYIIAVYAGIQLWQVGSAAVGILTAVISALAVVIAAVSVPLLIVTFQLTFLATVITGLAFLLGREGDLWNAIEGTGVQLKQLASDFLAVVAALRDGRLTISEVASIFVTEVQVSWVKIKGVFDAAVIYVANMLANIQLYVVRGNRAVMTALIEVAGVVATAFLGTQRLIAEAFDYITNKAADAIQHIPKLGKSVADSIRTNLASEIPKSAAFLDELTKKSKEQAAQLADEQAGLAVQYRKDQDANAAATDEAVAALRKGNDEQIKRNRLKQAEVAIDKDLEEFFKFQEEGGDGIHARDPQAILADLQELEQKRRDIIMRDTKDLAEDQQKLELAELESGYKRKLISTEDYIRRKNEIELSVQQEKLAGFDQQLDELENEKELATTDGQRIDIQRRINDVETQRQHVVAAILTTMQGQVTSAYELNKAQQDANRAFQNDLQLRAAQSSNDPEVRRQADLLELQQRQAEEHRKLLEREHSLQDEVMLAEQQRVEMTLAQREAYHKAREEEAALAKDQLEHSVALTQALFDAGRISHADAAERDRVATDDFVAELDRAKAGLEELKRTASDPEQVAAYQRQIDELTTAQVEATTKVVREQERINREVKESLQGPFTDFFKGIITGTETVREAFGNLLAAIADQMATFLASRIARDFLNALFPTTEGGGEGRNAGSAVAGGVGNVVSGIIGAIFHAADGGIVPGSGPNVDTVPAMLAPGEGIVNRPAVQYYSPEAIHAINQRLVPQAVLRSFSGTAPRPTGFHFAQGGVVPPGGGMGGATVVAATVAPTEETFDRLIRGGANAYFDFIAEHRDRHNAALGRQGG
jgi:hypothetical protein